MKILIVKDKICLSGIQTEYNIFQLKDQPAGLRNIMEKLLPHLKEVKTIEINEAKPSQSYFVTAAKNLVLDNFPKPVQTKFLFLAKLLKWHFGQQIIGGPPGVIGAATYCRLCRARKYPSSEECPSWCPSHRLNRAIFGPSYKIPRKPTDAFMQTLKRQLKDKKPTIIIGSK